MHLPARPRILHRALAALAVVATLLVPVPAHATPRWAISKPLAEGKQSPLAAAPLQKEVAREMEFTERHPVYFERIDVWGVRDPDKRPEPPRTVEQKFADTLNAGSPELIAGRSYDGYYYDGTLFWGSDPLSFAWKNITHWLKR
jgi:hypothetical protein